MPDQGNKYYEDHISIPLSLEEMTILDNMREFFYQRSSNIDSFYEELAIAIARPLISRIKNAMKEKLERVMISKPEFDEIMDAVKYVEDHPKTKLEEELIG